MNNFSRESESGLRVLNYSQPAPGDATPAWARRVFNIFALVSLLILIRYWIGVARMWIEIAPWRPHVMVSIGSWWFDALLGLPFAVLPVWWAIDRVIVRAQRRRRDQNALS